MKDKLEELRILHDTIEQQDGELYDQYHKIQKMEKIIARLSLQLLALEEEIQTGGRLPWEN